MKFLISIFSAVLVGTSATANEPAAKPIRLSACPSQTLIVRLNHENQSTKQEIVHGMRVVGDYLDLIVTPVIGPAHEVVLEVHPVCQRSDADDCGYESGWDEVQERVLKIRGVKTQCGVSEASRSSPMPPPPLPPPGGGAQEDEAGGGAQQDPKDELKDTLQRPRRRSEGGVTGSN